MERFLSYDRFISYHRNRLDVPPFKKDKLSLASLDQKFTQFTSILETGNDLMVKKVLAESFDQIQDGEEVYKFSIKNPKLLNLIYSKLKHKDDEIRRLSSLCFMQYCKVLATKELLNNKNYIAQIYNSFTDSSVPVRRNVLLGLLNFAESRYGIDSLLSNKILESVITMLQKEEDLEVLCLHLSLLNKIIDAETAPQIALKNNIINVLRDYLDNSNVIIQEQIVLNYGSICLCAEGKQACANAFLIENIIEKLKGETTLRLTILCTRYLMSVSILKQGKEEIYQFDGLSACLKILESTESEQIILNILQIIGNVAEEPRGRKYMLNELEKVEKFLDHENELIKEQAVITKEIITWIP